MTIFQRPDKPNEADAKPTAQGTPASPAPVLSEPIRPQSYAPPIAPAAPIAKPITSTNAEGAPMTSVISKALKITGQLESSEDIQIDGQIEGDVRGVLVKVGSNAKVKGTVYGDEVQLSGTVEGKIEAKKVVLSSTAHMSGDVVHQDIRIESGAYIDGHCKPDYGKTAETKAAESKPVVSKPTSVVRTAAE
jgi:cytoskeletal protein CcmA (bactofilin family)